MDTTAEIAVIGGTGFYKFLEDVTEVKVDTPYGSPSDLISLGTLGGRRVAFLPRHGRHHQLPPHMVNYRANLWALHELGVTRVIGPCAAGSLQPDVKPGDFVICDQFVDRTTGRKDTYYDGPSAVHISTADPYCPEMRRIAIRAAQDMGARFHPEVVLARELGMCYVNVSLITDYDAGLEGRPDVAPVTQDEVVRVFAEHNEILKDLIKRIIVAAPKERGCPCAEDLKRAKP